MSLETIRALALAELHSAISAIEREDDPAALDLVYNAFLHLAPLVARALVRGPLTAAGKRHLADNL